LSAETQVVWIEVLSRQGDVIARHRVEGAPGAEIRIGRAYDNHVVLDDPYVAARHLRIARDESGALIAEDLGSANGLYLNKDRRRTPRAPLDGAPTLRIGRTRLRVRQAGDAVPPERVSRPRMQMWPIAVILALAMLSGQFVTLWLRETAEQSLTDYLGPLLVICGFVAVWVTAWSVLTRVFSGRTRFERHLVIAVGGMLALWLLNELCAYAAFVWSQRELLAYRYVAQWLTGAYIVFLHLRQLNVTREGVDRWLKLKAGAVAALAMLAIGMQTLVQWESSQNTDRQVYLRGLKPPELRLARGSTQDEFFSQAAGLQSGLDRARTEKPAKVWEPQDDDDE
jgi:hypothetical protein